MKVAIIYHFLPHYRRAVMQALDSCESVSYTFYANDEDRDGIARCDMSNVKHHMAAPFYEVGPFIWQPKAIYAALSKPAYDAIIFLGNPYFLSTWVAAIIARFRGVPVLFWGHGWLRREKMLKNFLRNSFFRLANRTLVYSERGANIGGESGYPISRLRVIYNSLDVAEANDVIHRIESGSIDGTDPRAVFSNPLCPLVICTARLTRLCRFDLLIDAAARLRAEGNAINILLVGDGPERGGLEARAKAQGVSVKFWGACYDENILGQLIYKSDLTVSPGKVGLTAMHSLMYGTPVITHDNLDEQMPEVEAVIPGLTGMLFRHGDAVDLSVKISMWLSEKVDRDDVRRACRNEISNRWTPENQADLINKILLEVCRNGDT